MIRQAVRSLIALAVVTLLVESVIGQQTVNLDKITYRDKKDGTNKTVEGILKYGPIGLQILGGDKGDKVIETVSPGQIVRVVPNEANHPGIDRNAINAAIAMEDKKTKPEYEKARLSYDTMSKTADKKSKQFVDFKIAQMTQRVLDETADDEGWAALAIDAGKKWGGFLIDYKTGWELWPAARSATRLSAELGKFDEAARTWTRLTKKDVELSADLRLEAGIQEIDAQIRSRQWANAEASAKALGAAAPAGPLKDKLAIYELAANAGANSTALAAVPLIEKKIADPTAKEPGTKDPSVRGVAFGMIGELYMSEGKTRDAMWAFLWVDTVYNADKDEAFKAMCRLVEIFKTQGDDDRAKFYREKIRRARGAF